MATHDILINWSPQETRVAIVENGAVQELHIERALARGIVGNIYAGKVARVLPGMQSAFVEIGLERAAFLHVADIWEQRRAAQPSAAPAKPIEKILSEGQSLLVQVIKDPIGTKGARLSTQVSLAGRLLVYLPRDSHIGISQKIGSPELREQLRARMAALVQVPAEGGAGANGAAGELVAQHAHGERQVFVHDFAGLRPQRRLAHVMPELVEVGHVLGQPCVGHARRRGTHDVSAGVR